MQMTIHKRWWVKPYVHGCATFARLTSCEPDYDKMVKFVIDHGGLYYIDPDYREPWAANTCLILSTLLLGYSALMAMREHNTTGDVGTYIFGCMFLVLAHMFKVRSKR